MKRGDVETATSQFLALLALKPDHVQAADALRALERERNKHLVAARFARNQVARPSNPDGATSAHRPAMPAERNELEHAALLGRQGEVDEAIKLLERRLGANRRDTAVCPLLAELYAQKGEKLLPQDKSQATAWFERALRLDGSNPLALARLNRLNTGALTGSLASIAMTQQDCVVGR